MYVFLKHALRMASSIKLVYGSPDLRQAEVSTSCLQGDGGCAIGNGLKVDLGREDKQEPDRKPEAVRDMEANSWEQSFHSYVEEQKEL